MRYSQTNLQTKAFWILLTATAIIGIGACAIHADEGMWLFSNPPKKLLKEKYGFAPDDAWYSHLQQASVRINAGGSGSFVSPNGLVMTNHHVGADALQKLGTKTADLLQVGFYAKTQADEIKCPDSEFNVLVSVEDVTARVMAAVKSPDDPAAAEKQRRAEMNTIEQESTQKNGLRSDVVTLYHGGLYHLYRYKKYTDIRLVFAPEQDIAFFGGDPDNFEYPRYDLDICFFRVYEDGKPVHTPYLKWNPASLKEGDLTFVSGNPGTTERMNTVRHLEVLRDYVLPGSLDVLRRREVLLTAFSQRSAENARRARDMLLGIQNARKARLGGLAGLQDPAVMALKRAEEEKLRKAAENSPHAADCQKAFETIDKSLAVFLANRNEFDLLEGGKAFNSELFAIARTLVRLAEETQKPNADRLREYRDSNLESLKQELFSDAPIYADLETVLLADSLSYYLEKTVPSSNTGQQRELAEKVLAGKSPEQRAAELVGGTKLADVAVRRRLAEGGLKAIEASDDPMIQLARLVDKPSRRVRMVLEQQVGEPQRVAYGRLADIRFALLGAETYPDATFTPRLSFGPVRRCVENGKPAPAWTTIGGLYRTAEEHQNVDPFALPKRWKDCKDRLNMDTPLNFVCTADIIGGNSGSPVVNRDGELVGIIFDGDLPSLVWDYIYTEPGRSLAVHGSAILEALRKVYDAAPLADEIAPPR